MTFAIATLLVGLFGGLLGLAGSAINSSVNKKATDETNATNLQIAQETNAANVEQAELAYQRSLPTAQVQQMMQAGMTRAGALSALQGGGSYTAPTLQSAHMEKPEQNLDFNALAERLTNIPANVQQSRMVKEQTDALIAEERRKEESARQQLEEHNQRMEFARNEEIRKQYGHDAVVMTDKLRSRIDELITKKGVNRDSLDSEQALVNALGLERDPYWQNAPSSARNSVLDYVRGIAAENRANAANARANRQQNNADRAADDTHNISRQQLSDLKDRADDYRSEKDARQKEYKLRELRAQFETIAAEYDLSIAELRKNFYIDDNGQPKLHTKRSQNAKEFWNMVAKVLPLETLGDLLRGVLSVTK